MTELSYRSLTWGWKFHEAMGMIVRTAGVAANRRIAMGSENILVSVVGRRFDFANRKTAAHHFWCIQESTYFIIRALSCVIE